MLPILTLFGLWALLSGGCAFAFKANRMTIRQIS